MYKYDRQYSNGEITVFWQPLKCVKAAVCMRELPGVFRPAQRPWVYMGGAPSSRIMEIVDRCPSDALTYSVYARAESQDTALVPEGEPVGK